MIGRKCYLTPAFSGVPIKGDKIKGGYLTRAFSGAHQWVECYITPALSRVPIKGEKIRSGFLNHAL